MRVLTTVDRMCLYLYVYIQSSNGDGFFVEVNTDSRSLKCTSSLTQHSYSRTYVHLRNEKHVQLPPPIMWCG